MSTIAYFIGGPLDLTKMTIHKPERQLHALNAVPAMPIGEMDAKAKTVDYDLLTSRCLYTRLSVEPIRQPFCRDETVVYVFEGITPRRRRG